MILILLAAVFISAALQEYIDAIVIFIIVVLNTILGFWQEFKAENAMAALKKMTVPNVRVLREAEEQQISAKDLVPGDILLTKGAADGLIDVCRRILINGKMRFWLKIPPWLKTVFGCLGWLIVSSMSISPGNWA